MHRFLRPLFALLLSLLLVSGQQAALAHMLGHAVLPTALESVQQNDSEHDAALTLAHVCTTCIAFTDAAAAPPAAIPPLALAADRSAMRAVAVPPASTLPFNAVYRSRAPPPL